ncbi:glutathione S-transferase, partial [Lecanoromycetidae sp. Uapishka_2]
MPDLTLYFLQASRSIRIAWLLEELGLDYNLEGYDRESSGLAPAAFKQTCGTHLGKAPVLKDGDLILQESGAITEYLCEHYDATHRLLPTDQASRIKVREFIHAAEGAFMVHCLPTVYNRRIDATLAEKLAPGIEQIVAKDLDWLEAELKKGNGRYLVGDHITSADTMVAFSIQFIFRMGLGPNDRRWVGIERWLRNIEGEEGYQRAVARTGYRL